MARSLVFNQYFPVILAILVVSIVAGGVIVLQIQETPSTARATLTGGTGTTFTGGTTPVCGCNNNATCEAGNGETLDNCKDCSTCGDGACSFGETILSCNQDCLEKVGLLHDTGIIYDNASKNLIQGAIYLRGYDGKNWSPSLQIEKNSLPGADLDEFFVKSDTQLVIDGSYVPHIAYLRDNSSGGKELVYATIKDKKLKYEIVHSVDSTYTLEFGRIILGKNSKPTIAFVEFTPNPFSRAFIKIAERNNDGIWSITELVDQGYDVDMAYNVHRELLEIVFINSAGKDLKHGIYDYATKKWTYSLVEITDSDYDPYERVFSPKIIIDTYNFNPNISYFFSHRNFTNCPDSWESFIRFASYDRSADKWSLVNVHQSCNSDLYGGPSKSGLGAATLSFEQGQWLRLQWHDFGSVDYGTTLLLSGAQRHISNDTDEWTLFSLPGQNVSTTIGQASGMTQDTLGQSYIVYVERLPDNSSTLNYGLKFVENFSAVRPVFKGANKDGIIFSKIGDTLSGTSGRYYAPIATSLAIPDNQDVEYYK